MPRPPLYATPMTKIVKFRVSADEREMLEEMQSDDESLSELMRALIRDAHKRYKRRKR